MKRFVLQRCWYGVLSLLGVVLLVFVLSRLTGSPARLYLPQDATEAQVHEYNMAHGFDDPILLQLVHYVWSLLHLDFGESLGYGSPALQVVLSRYPETLKLAFLAVIIFTACGVAIGATSAAHGGSRRDGAFRIMSLGALSIPDFWVAILCIEVFAVQLGVLPTSGSGTWQYWVLPLVTLSLRPMGVLAQVTRTAMLEELDSEYARVARTKGVSRNAVVYKHALRNAALPIVTVAGVLLAQLVNGAVVIETVFGWPGVGKLMIDAIHGRDFAIIQTVVLVTGLAIMIMNIGIDFIYSWLNPQIRLGGVAAK